MEHIRVSYIETELLKSYGTDFENISSFIMHLIDPRFVGTRTTKDGGIDGIKIIGNGRALYSIYGPKETKDWKRAKGKLNDDANDVKEFLKRNNLIIRKWCIIINRNLDGDDIALIQEVCKNNGFSKNQYEILTPNKLIAEIERQNVTLTVGRFLGLINYREIPFTDLRPHAVAKEILERLTTIKNESKESKKEELELMRNGIIIQAFLYENDGRRIVPKGMLRHEIATRTKIGENYIKSYYYKDGLFKVETKNRSELPHPIVSTNEAGYIVLTVRNLAIIYSLIQGLIRNLENYDIELTLKRMLKPHRVSYFEPFAGTNGLLTNYLKNN
jgi:hypothetical protein